MVLFYYDAKNISGVKVSDVVEAENIKSAAGKLRALGYFPTSIVPHAPRKLAIFKKRGVSRKDIGIFTRRLADSIKGGLPLARALSVLQGQTENPGLSSVTSGISGMIREGKSLSDALAQYPLIFSKMYISMVRAGEAAGVLETVLARIADFSEKEEEIRYRVQSALAYPLLMLFVGMGSVIFLLNFVIPKFEVMFQDLGQSMPLPTKILILASHFVRFGWWIYIPAAVLAIVLLKKWYKTAGGQLLLAETLLKLPAVGAFIKKDMVSRFIRIMSILLTNGVPILDALRIAGDAMDNRLFSRDINNVYNSVKEGQGLSKPLSRSALFPPLVSEMIAIGEETGNLESSLDRIAQIYEREVEYAVKTMTSLLEPVIILFAGCIVCFIALSMLMPVFQVSSGLH